MGSPGYVTYGGNLGDGISIQVDQLKIDGDTFELKATTKGGSFITKQIRVYTPCIYEAT